MDRGIVGANKPACTHLCMRKPPEDLDAGFWQLSIPFLNLLVASHLAILQTGNVFGHILLPKRAHLHAIIHLRMLLVYELQSRHADDDGTWKWMYTSS